MKRKLISVFLSATLLIGCLPMTAVADTGVAINAINFPDQVFREYISSNFDNGDGVLSAIEISNVTTISLSRNDNFKSLVGVKNFTGLKKLDCSFCENKDFTSLDVSGMTSLEVLDCAPSSVASLNVTGSTNVRNTV